MNIYHKISTMLFLFLLIPQIGVCQSRINEKAIRAISYNIAMNILEPKEAMIVEIIHSKVKSDDNKAVTKERRKKLLSLFHNLINQPLEDSFQTGIWMRDLIQISIALSIASDGEGQYRYMEIAELFVGQNIDELSVPYLFSIKVFKFFINIKSSDFEEDNATRISDSIKEIDQLLKKYCRTECKEIQQYYFQFKALQKVSKTS